MFTMVTTWLSCIHQQGGHQQHMSAVSGTRCKEHMSAMVGPRRTQTIMFLQVVVNVVEAGKLVLYPHILLACIALLGVSYVHLWELLLDLLSKVSPACLSVQPSVSLVVCQCSPSASLPVCLFVCLSLFVCQCIPSASLPVCLSVCLSVCLFVCQCSPSASLPACLPAQR